MNKKLAIEAGLVEAGLNDEGDQLYIGTQKQWQEYEIFEMDEQIKENGFNGEFPEDKPQFGKDYWEGIHEEQEENDSRENPEHYK